MTRRKPMFASVLAALGLTSLLLAKPPATDPTHVMLLNNLEGDRAGRPPDRLKLWLPVDWYTKDGEGYWQFDKSPTEPCPFEIHVAQDGVGLNFTRYMTDWNFQAIARPNAHGTYSWTWSSTAMFGAGGEPTSTSGTATLARTREVPSIPATQPATRPG